MEIDTYIKSLELKNIKEAEAIKNLIFYFFKLKGLDFKLKIIPEDLFNPLKKATAYWINLTRDEEEFVRIEEFNIGFYQVLFDATVNNIPINYLVILCPSYKKGLKSFGVKLEPGLTTYVAFRNGLRIRDNTEKLGIPCSLKAYFYDIAIENSGKFSEENWRDLDINILTDKIIAKTLDINYTTMSEEFEILNKKIGKYGVKKEILEDLIKELKINKKVLQNVIDSSILFYKEQFGWEESESIFRAKEVCCAYSLESIELRKFYKSPVVVYSAYSYDRSYLYSGPNLEAKIGIIYPKRPVGNSTEATISVW